MAEDELFNDTDELQDAANETQEVTAEDLGTMFEGDWGDWEKAYAPKINEFREFQALYDSQGSSFYGMSGDEAVANVSIMETFRVVETAVSTIIAAIWGPRPWFSTSAPSADEMMTQGVAEWERILEHQFRNPFAQFETKRDIFLRGTVLNGTGICETNWHLRTRWKDLGDAFAPKELGDGPAIEPIQLTDFAFEPHGTDVDAESSAWIDIAKDPLPGFVRNKLLALKKVKGAIVNLDLFERVVREGGDNKPNKDISHLKNI